MTVLATATVIVVGFVACAEFGSFAFVHPVLRRLPDREWILVEQGLLKTFGRFMPFGMTVSPVLVGILASGASGVAMPVLWASTTALGVALVSTIAVNVAINLSTAGWDPDAPPHDWRSKRRRWDAFQGLRASLQLLGFIVLCGGVIGFAA